MRRHWGVALASVALAGTLAAGTLVGCGDTAGQTTSEGDGTEEVVEVANPSGNDADGLDDADDMDGLGDKDDMDLLDVDMDDEDVEALAAASGTVEVDAFTFDIPAYWEGKVDVAIEHDDDHPSARVYLSGNPEAILATLLLVDGDQPDIVGDIGLHVVGSVASGNGTHVEVWAINWPWLAATQAEGGDMGFDVDEATLAELVDLSSGGVYSYEEAASDGPDAVSAAENGFMNAELVPTVAFG